MRGGDRDLQPAGGSVVDYVSTSVFFLVETVTLEACFAQPRFDISKLLPSSHLVWV